MAPRFRQLPLFENENAIDIPNGRKPMGDDDGGAIELDASYRERAKTDTDFDGIRDNEQFQALVGS
jgi:hypothetical protein